MSKDWIEEAEEAYKSGRGDFRQCIETYMPKENKLEKLSEDERTELIRLCDYFWNQKGRLDGFSNCEYIETEFPELREAWMRNKRSEREITNLVSNMQ